MSNGVSTFLQAASQTWPPDPIAYPLEWDKVLISGVTNPGLARVKEFKRKWIWDEKKGKGQLFPTLTFTGAYLARGQIEFYLRTGPNFTGGIYQDLQNWVTFAKLFNYQTSAKAIPPKPVVIYHPSFAIANLAAFVCEDIHNPIPVTPGDSLYKVTVTLIEYAPPPAVNVTSTPAGASAKPPQSSNPPGAIQDAHDVAFQKEFAAQMAAIQAPP